MSCRTFPKFSQLPGEIRNKIWQSFIDLPQIVPARFDFSATDWSCFLVPAGPCSVLRSVCKESRSWVTFNESNHWKEALSKIQIGREQDTLWLPRYEIVHHVTNIRGSVDCYLTLTDWEGPNISKLALPIECLHELLISNDAEFIKSFLLRLYWKHVREIIFVIGSSDAVLNWTCDFVSPKTMSNSLFHSDAARESFFAFHDLQKRDGEKGILDRKRDLTWPEAEEKALKLFKKTLAEHYKATVEHGGECAGFYK